MNEQSYKNTLHNYEPTFNPAHWEAMQAKMENATPPVKRLVWYKSMHWAAIWLVFAFVGSGSSAWFTFNTLEEANIIVPSQQNELLGLSEERNKKNIESDLKKEIATGLEQQFGYIKRKPAPSSKQLSNSKTDTKATEITSITPDWATAKDVEVFPNLEIALIGKDELGNLKSLDLQDKIPTITKNEMVSGKKPLKKGSWALGISGGVNNYSKTAEEDFTSPLLTASINYAISNRIQTNIFVATRTSETKLPHGEFSKSELLVGAEVKYHIPISHKTSIYVGGGAAHKTVNEKENTLTPSMLTSFNATYIKEEALEKEHDLKKSDWIGFVTAGIQHKFTQKVSAFVETSQGLANIRGGLQVNLY